MATEHANQQITLPTTVDPIILETLESTKVLFPKISEVVVKDNTSVQEEGSSTTSRRATPIKVRVPAFSPEANHTDKVEETKEANKNIEEDSQDVQTHSQLKSNEDVSERHHNNESRESSVHERFPSRKVKSQQSNTKPNNRKAGNHSMLARLPTPGPEAEDRRLNKLSARRQYPPQMMRLATVSVRSRMKKASSRSLTIDQPQLGQNKVITWDKATNARPPLRIDMEGPGPCTYTPTNKPLKERNSPAWTIGTRCFVEKDGGSRTSWGKSWFQANDPWHQKANFYSEPTWPSPPSYKKKPTLGPNQNAVIENVAPSYQIGVRRKAIYNKSDSDTDPGPNEYNRESSDLQTLKRAPAFTMGIRHGGSILWSSAEYNNSPGPGSYNPRLHVTQHHKPSYTIRGFRRSKSHELGPFMAF